MAIVVSRYSHSITDLLLKGAAGAFLSRFPEADEPSVIDAPGAFELPVLCMHAAAAGYDGVLAIGCIIKGETRHDEFIAHAVCEGLVAVSVTTGVPVALGVLTVDTVEQAQERAGGRHGNKGEEAMNALLDTLEAAAAIQPPRPAAATSTRTPSKKKAATRSRGGARGGR